MPRHVIYDDGLYREVRRGLSRGCPLSPLLGALYLQALDARLERLGLFYVRFMDDWIVLAPTRWKLRQAIKTVNQTLNELKLGKHPDKTFIGRIERGFAGSPAEPVLQRPTPSTDAQRVWPSLKLLGLAICTIGATKPRIQHGARSAATRHGQRGGRVTL